MLGSIANEFYRKIVQKIAPAARLTHFWDLQGGISAKTTALEFELHGNRKRVVVRQYGGTNLKSNPRIATAELRLLNMLHAAGLPTTQPHFADESGELLPSPYLVIDYIDGRPLYDKVTLNQIQRMADVLADIHSAQDAMSCWSFLPKQEEVVANQLANRPTELDFSLSEGQIRAALELMWPPAQKNKSTLLHGDFWPGNLLWSQGEIAAIIDWEDAGVGDPLADLANARLEILMFFGVEAMQEFTDHYSIRMESLDYTNLPYWDLSAALRPAGRMSGFGLERETLQTFRERHKLFVNQALSRFKR